MNRQRIEGLARQFWEEAGDPARFPRDLERAILGTKSLSIAKLEGLSPTVIQAWFNQRGYPLRFETKERKLNGCVVAYRGAVLIFLEKRLGYPDEQMVLGHEFGHFLAQYEYPRERVCRRLGERMFEVYDGDRQATIAEQLAATLAGVPLEAHVHYMDRLEGGTYLEPVNQAERVANALALELMAPWRAVLGAMKEKAHVRDSAGFSEILRKKFGLPAEWAAPYARELVLIARKRRTFSERLGL
jgi:hypothetical protein